MGLWDSIFGGSDKNKGEEVNKPRRAKNGTIFEDTPRGEHTVIKKPGQPVAVGHQPNVPGYKKGNKSK